MTREELKQKFYAPIDPEKDLNNLIGGVFAVDSDREVLRKSMLSTMEYSTRLFTRGIQAAKLRIATADQHPEQQQGIIDVVLWEANQPLDTPDYPTARAWLMEAVALTEQVLEEYRANKE